MNTFTILTLTLIHATTSSQLYPLTPPPSTLQCSIETNVPSYPSTFNQTSLLSCHNATRPEKICIVGAGSSGIHLGWLLKRRGFNNTILFDRNNRTGGDVWTYSKNESGASFTRELGAAFLSPDYDEVRGLLKRFNRTEVPISVTKQMNFHSQNVTETAKNWYTNWIFNITGVRNVTIQNQHVQAALLKYNTIHESIFGTYEGRFPPLPTSSTAMQLLNQTAISFLMTNQLEILHPLMYQFFVMQGMGLLEPMSVYYMLKWCSPKSMSQGGFGNDHDTPLAMLKEGFGGLLNDMVQDVQLNVQLNTEIVQINRNENFGVQIYYTTSTLQKDPKNQRPEQEEETTMEQCDLVVLSGAIPKLLRSNILTAPTEMERDTFGTMEPMQFLVSLLDLKTKNSNNLLHSKNLKKHPIPDTMNSSSVPYKALEYWPDGYKENSGVIVRRDIGYAETNVAHTRGGLQTFSYNGADLTLSNKSTHWNSQKKWIENQGYDSKETQVIEQFWIDSYYYHWNVTSITNIWKIDTMQMLQKTRTLYIGGAASYETVEDSFQHNLKLVQNLIDQQRYPLPIRTPMIEQYVYTIPCNRMNDFIAATNSTWDVFLIKQPGFSKKYVLTELAPSTTSFSTTSSSTTMCNVRIYIEWNARPLFDAISTSERNAVVALFNKTYGTDPPVPSSRPLKANQKNLNVKSTVGTKPFQTKIKKIKKIKKTKTSTFQIDQNTAFEINRLDLPCQDMSKFFACDNSTWTNFLKKQIGFVSKEQLYIPTTTATATTILSNINPMNCSAYAHVKWSHRNLWKNISVPDLIATQKEFVECMGYAPTLTRLPTANGLDLYSTVVPEHPTILGLAGFDVVAYHFLKEGEIDVPGSSSFISYLDPVAQHMLPPSLLPIHSQKYEFWFSTLKNKKLFDENPWKYLPAFGGHCTHGISEAFGGMDAKDLVDGRRGFTCVNGPRWKIVNGILYMNSCSMYEDFIKDPEGDIRKAEKQWKKWGFDINGWKGPMNDACLQDYQAWMKDDSSNPIGHLIPPNCVTGG